MRVPVQHPWESSGVRGLRTGVQSQLPTVNSAGWSFHPNHQLPPRPATVKATDHTPDHTTSVLWSKVIVLQVVACKGEKPPSPPGDDALWSHLGQPCSQAQDSKLHLCSAKPPRRPNALPWPHHLPSEMQPPDPDVQALSKLNLHNCFTRETHRTAMSVTLRCQGQP